MSDGLRYTGTASAQFAGARIVAENWHSSCSVRYFNRDFSFMTEDATLLILYDCMLVCVCVCVRLRARACVSHEMSLISRRVHFYSPM
jgi:hypothetical protein